MKGKSLLSSWQFWAGLLISLGAFALALRGVQLQKVWEALLQADYLYLVPAFLLLLVAVLTKAERWGVLFYPLEGLPRKHLFAAMGIGYLGNNIFPARIGELIRAYVIGAATGASKSQALATIVVERLVDILTLLLFMVVLLPTLSLPAWLQRSLLTLGVATVGLTLVLALVPAVERWLQSGIRWLERRIPKLTKLNLESQVSSFMVGLAVLRVPKLAIPISGWSLVSWVSSGLAYYAVMMAFHLHLPVTAAFWVVVITSLGMVIPSSPGYVGVFHYLTVLTLGFFGVDQGIALSYALVLHAVVYIFLSATGVYGMAVESLGFGELTSVRE